MQILMSTISLRRELSLPGVRATPARPPPARDAMAAMADATRRDSDEIGSAPFFHSSARQTGKFSPKCLVQASIEALRMVVQGTVEEAL